MLDEATTFIATAVKDDAEERSVVGCVYAGALIFSGIAACMYGVFKAPEAKKKSIIMASDEYVLNMQEHGTNITSVLLSPDYMKYRIDGYDIYLLKGDDEKPNEVTFGFNEDKLTEKMADAFKLTPEESKELYNAITRAVSDTNSSHTGVHDSARLSERLKGQTMAFGLAIAAVGATLYMHTYR